MRWLDDSTLQLQQSITMLGNENAPKLRKWPLGTSGQDGNYQSLILASAP
jgi:hypothetical protein